MTSTTADEAAADAPALHLFDVQAALILKALTYLDMSDVQRTAAVNTTMCGFALDEWLWRWHCMRAFGKDFGKDFEPSDHLWRAEFVARRQAKRREEAYMRALSQGRVGKVEPPKARLQGPRFSALDGPAMTASIATKRAAARAAAEAAAAAATASMAAELLSNIQLASKSESVTVRQGTCTWSALKPAVSAGGSSAGGGSASDDEGTGDSPARRAGGSAAGGSAAGGGAG